MQSARVSHAMGETIDATISSGDNSPDITHHQAELLNRPRQAQQELEYDSDGNKIPKRPPIRKSKRALDLDMNAVHDVLLSDQEETFNDSEYV